MSGSNTNDAAIVVDADGLPRVEVVMGNLSQWVLVKRFAEITGYSENAVRHKIKGGVWIEGRIWRKAPDGRVFLNLDEFERWVESAPQSAAF